MDMTDKNKKTKQAEFTTWFGPLLDALRALGGSGKPKEAVNQIAKALHIPDLKLEETMKSGTPRFHNQVAWARQYLVWEGFIDDSKHGVWTLTNKGQATSLTEEESRNIFLKWVEIHKKTRKTKSQTALIQKQEQEEPEQLEHELTPTLLEVLQSVTPTGFEQICKRLLREHGFENVEVTQASHDGGIDGYGTLELNPFVSI